MKSHFKTFRTFHDECTLKIFTDLLEKNDILYSVENHSQSFDPSFAYNSFNKEFSVEIAPENFQQIYEIEQSEVENQIKNAPADYYLFSYSQKELEEIVAARDEWNAYDYLLAQKILKEKGASKNIEYPEVQLQNRISELKKITDIHPVWLLVFYVIAFFGGFFAIIIGYYIKTAKKVLPNGETISRFTKRDILHGTLLFYAGIFFLIFWIVRGVFFFPSLHLKY